MDNANVWLIQLVVRSFASLSNCLTLFGPAAAKRQLQPFGAGRPPREGGSQRGSQRANVGHNVRQLSKGASKMLRATGHACAHGNVWQVRVV